MSSVWRRLWRAASIARPALVLVLPVVLLLPASAATPRAAVRLPDAQAADVASYRIDARLDPAAKTVEGTGQITYRNPSQDTLGELWLRLYLRAFSGPDTVWMRESGGQHRGVAADADTRGDITMHKLSLAGGDDLLATAMLTDTLLHVPLDQPLRPGESIDLDVAWTSKLPRVFARTGYGGRDDTFFMVGQWYPKMAVYDRGRWDTEPWHANAEFFHDFGSYDVRISVPPEYVVAATGMPAGRFGEADGGETHSFTAHSVTDFAFAASPDFRVHEAKAGDVGVALYLLPEHDDLLQEYISTATGALQSFGAWFGPYPHARYSVVDVPDNAAGAGGMEYPMLVTGGTIGLPVGTGATAMVVAHETAHQWWPMQTATNEGREPWLDEGLTEYSSMRYLLEAGRRIGFGPLSLSAPAFDRSEYALASDQPANLPAWNYSEVAYAGAVYGKPAVGLLMLERVVGTDALRRAMAAYLQAYRWKHPTAADFRASLEQSLDPDLDWFFDDYTAGRGVVDYAVAGLQQESTSSTVRLTREGAVPVPVEVEVTLASGEQRVETWDGRATSTSLSFPSADPVVRVVLDSERKLAAELDVLDNARSTHVQAGPSLTLGGRLAFWAQTIVQMLGLWG